MFRKPTKRGGGTQVQSRQRKDESSGDEAGDGEASAMLDKIGKKRRANPMIQTTKKKRDDDGKPSALSSSDSDSDDGPTGVIVEHSFAASGSTDRLGPKDMGATATLDIDTDIGADAQAQFERVQKQLKEGVVKDGKVLYKGSAMYGAKVAVDTVMGNASSGMNRLGPMRAPQFLRQTVRWDYAPDICKDYKETGCCTFGDSCKFVHDRGDYKHGWEIERDWAAGKYNQTDTTDYEIHDDDGDLPDDCYICGRPFTNPIVTKCKHYFCEACALNAFKKSKKCKICNENTGGVFNIAKDLIAKMNGSETKRVKDEDEEEEEEWSTENDKEKAGPSRFQPAESNDDENVEEEATEIAEHIENEIKHELAQDEAAGDEVVDDNEIDHEGDSNEVEIKMEEMSGDEAGNDDENEDDEDEDEDSD